MKLVFRRLFHKNAMGVWIMRERPDGTYDLAKPAELVFENQGSSAFLLPEPTLEIRAQEWEQLRHSALESLREAGVDLEPPDRKGQIEAMKDHLESLKMSHESLNQIARRDRSKEWSNGK